MAVCRNCAAEFSDDSVHCPECGVSPTEEGREDGREDQTTTTGSNQGDRAGFGLARCGEPGGIPLIACLPAGKPCQKMPK